MKRELVLFALIAAAMIVLSPAGAWAFNHDDVLDGIRYDVLAERVFEGVLDGKPYVLDGLMYFPLRTSGTMADVQIGPKEFVEGSGFKLEVGQMVTVVGMPVVIKDRVIVLAREIRNKSSVFVVRDRNGQPMWKMDRPIQMDPELGDNRVPVCQMIDRVAPLTRFQNGMPLA
jgi:hypothetical protein